MAGIAPLLLAALVSTDLLSLVGGDSELFTALNRSLSGQARVLCTTPEAVEAAKAAAEFEELPSMDKVLEFYAMHGAGLLSAKDRAMLENGETNKLMRAVMRRDYAGMGLYPKAEDPYYFLNNYLMEMKSFLPKSGEGTILQSGKLTDSEIKSLIDLARTRDDVFLSGAPFHTMLAKRKSVKEINLLSAVSLLAAVAAGFWLFGNLKFLLPMALTLLAGFAAGTIALFWAFGTPHVLTFIFGTSLIGLGVDYCYHGRSENLAKALVTTLLAFSPLLFSHVAVLNQMAVFTMTGLVAIYLCVLCRR